MTKGDMTIKEIEDARSEMNTKVAEILQKFESDTSVHIGYINIEREKNVQAKEDNCCNCRPTCYDEDRGAIVFVNIDIRID